jgi:hypothetical protein
VDRLAAVVYSIQQDSAAVPKGAYMQTHDGAVVRNKSFHGLSLAEASRCSYYLHFSPPHPQSSSVNNVRIGTALFSHITVPYSVGHPQALSLSGYH